MIGNWKKGVPILCCLEANNRHGNGSAMFYIYWCILLLCWILVGYFAEIFLGKKISFTLREYMYTFLTVFS